jgi:deoxyribodipyrimidine photolyase-related protein
MSDASPIPVTSVPTEHFFTTRETLKEMFKGKKSYLMESFYRAMRRQHSILMEEESPVGGEWNFDHENRSPLPKGVTPPAALHFHNDASSIVNMLKAAEVKTIGEISPNDFRWPISREQALTALEHFATSCLPYFGQYQDAMHTQHPFLFHSLLSFPLNLKLLSPLEVIQRCVKEWQNRPEQISLPQIEGFVRQILGWREYMRGLYWARMPEYETLNYFGADLNLPSYYWSGETKMRCMRAAISQSLEHAYAHHIQRLMITGNFALIAGINPDEVDRWYLGIYIDALQWVELPNTRGMSLFADGGIVATKPYAASANYIGKMSNYCKECEYDPKDRIGDNACPFNSLYWDFFDRNRKRLEKNPRIGMAFRNIDRMKDGELVQIRLKAAQLRANLSSL